MALHTLWHTFERRAGDIGMPYGPAFVEHGSNEARFALPQSVWHSKDESATSTLRERALLLEKINNNYKMNNFRRYF